MDQIHCHYVQRAERYNQRPTLLIVTGQKGIGRKPFAAHWSDNCLKMENMCIIWVLEAFYMGLERT